VKRAAILLAAFAVLFSARTADPQSSAGPDILAEIQQIRAIDNHAHPVCAVRPGEPPDRGFDALPVENMEPSSDPVNLRPGAPALAEAAQALYPERNKQRVVEQQGVNYPSWVLDRMGVEAMLANRVEMCPGIGPPRFLWVPYADALLFPLDNSAVARQTPDRQLFFPLEDALRRRYLDAVGLGAPPPTLDEYLARVVTPTLERQRKGGAVAEKFEAAYLRPLDFANPDRASAARVYARYIGKPAPPDADYKLLQDYLFRYIAAECGRLGMAVHIHAMAGAGSYFDVAGVNPLNLESVFDDPALRKTRFVLLHGGWPFTREITALLSKPNVYLDFSMQDLLLPPATLAATLRQWLEWVPEKVLFGTDAYPYSRELGWEESGWMAARGGREALAIALTAMLRDGEIDRARASVLARMVLRDNARSLYGLK
jgi:hypothetical protein